MSKLVLPDTGFWRGILIDGDDYSQDSFIYYNTMRNYRVLMPWPIMYESFSTKLCKKRHQAVKLKNLLSRLKIIKVDDIRYREIALEQMIEIALNTNRRISLVDMVVRNIIEEWGRKIHFFITNNPPDFHDVCHNKGVEMVIIREN